MPGPILGTRDTAVKKNRKTLMESAFVLGAFYASAASTLSLYTFQSHTLSKQLPHVLSQAHRGQSLEQTCYQHHDPYPDD